MRFFASDGKTISGPSEIEELLQRPDFDGDTLVCPVGSENSADWKPALAYPPLRDALLSPARRAPPPPPPPAPTQPCPSCGSANPERARFCNECGTRMDGTAPTPSVSEPAPAPVPAPVSSPFTEPSPSSFPAPEPLVELTPAAAAPPPAFTLTPDPVPPAPAPAPARSPADAAALRKTLIAAFVGAVAASGGLGWWLLRPAARAVPVAKEVSLTPPAPPNEPLEESAKSAPIVAPPAALPAQPATSPAPVPTSPLPTQMSAMPPAPVMKKKPAPKRPARAPRARRLKPAPPAPAQAAADGDAGSAPLKAPDSGPTSAPAAAPDAPADDGFILPGVPRRVTAKPAAKAKSGAAADAAPAAPAEPPAPADGSGDDGTMRQVREQFEFCAQLLTQNAFADHFDTCLCSGAKQASPYFGSRDTYAAALRKSAAAGKLETGAKVSDIVIDAGIAKVTATWITRSGSSNEETENWQLEDGLWCRAP